MYDAFTTGVLYLSIFGLMGWGLVIAVYCIYSLLRLVYSLLKLAFVTVKVAVKGVGRGRRD